MRNKLQNYITNVNKCERLFAEKSRLQRVKAEYTPSVLGSGFGGVHSSGTSTPTENAVIHKSEFEEKIDLKIRNCEQEIEAVEAEIKSVDDYISEIEDIKLQEIFNLRYKQGVSWANIALQFYYAPSSWAMLKGCVERYINEH